jgi:hypothetical protein
MIVCKLTHTQKETAMLYWTAQDIRNAYENGQLSESDAAQLVWQLGETL